MRHISFDLHNFTYPGKTNLMLDSVSSNKCLVFAVSCHQLRTFSSTLGDKKNTMELFRLWTAVVNSKFNLCGKILSGLSYKVWSTFGITKLKPLSCLFLFWVFSSIKHNSPWSDLFIFIALGVKWLRMQKSHFKLHRRELTSRIVLLYTVQKFEWRYKVQWRWRFPIL